jgi:hypothetical protein
MILLQVVVTDIGKVLHPMLTLLKVIEFLSSGYRLSKSSVSNGQVLEN